MVYCATCMRDQWEFVCSLLITWTIILQVLFLYRNTSLGIGMCPEGEWEKLSKGSLVRSMSPYSSRLLDIRMPGSSLESLEVSTEEGIFFILFMYESSLGIKKWYFLALLTWFFAEFLLHRIIFLVLGVVMMTLAPSLSKSVAFYYSSAMAVGIILVILIVLFQVCNLWGSTSQFLCAISHHHLTKNKKGKNKCALFCV